MGAGVALVGFMGAGKSTVGRALADRLGWPWVDLDDELVARFGPIAAQFERDGVGAFRAREREEALRWCDGRPRVLSTGGGTLLDPEARHAIARAYRTVWLDVPLEAIRLRLGAGTGRPLWDDTVGYRYAERLPIYLSADFRVDGERSVEHVVESITAWVGSCGP